MKVFLVSGPRKNVIPGYWLYDKLKADFKNIESIYIRKDDATPRYLRTFKQIWSVIKVLLQANKEDLILVYDNDTTGIYIALALSFFRRKLIVYKINSMAKDKSKLYSPIKRLLVRQAYKNIYTSVNNNEIAHIYSSFLELPLKHFIPIPDSISDLSDNVKIIKDCTEKGYIFMGGATHRDYNLFIEVARNLPQYKFVAVTFEQYKHFFTNAPQNISVYYGLDEKAFSQKVANSNIVFVPLTNDVQGGQLVIMQGALFKKPIITTESIAIHTYLDDKSAFLLPIGEKKKSITIISELMSNKNLRLHMGEKAYKRISTFTTDSIYEEYKAKLFPSITEHNK